LPVSIKELGIKVFDEETQVFYEGERPQKTHELSAQRLSNEVYRDCAEERSEAGVKIKGMDYVLARLEGATREYTLTIEELVDKSAMQQAYERSIQARMPKDMTVFGLELTDNSGIPITKLGKQLLQVTIPVPKIFRTQNIYIYAIDRNGQLETVDAVRMKVNGIDSVRFEVSQVSQYGITGEGAPLQEVKMMEETTSIVSFSEGPENADNRIVVKYLFGGLLFLTGAICILWKK